MERGRRLAIGVVGVAVMFLTAGIVMRAVGGGGDDVDLTGTPNSIESLTGDTSQLLPGDGLEPEAPPDVFDPGVPPGLDPVPETLPEAPVATIPLPDLSTGSTTGTGGPTTTARGPAFNTAGVWVVKADGSSPILVAGGATAGVAAGGTWVAFVEGGTVKAVPRSDLRARRDLATGVSGGAAQGLPIAGGKRGVAFLQGGRVLLVDPAAPAQPAVAYEAPAADAVAAEEDGDGRLAWADAGGVHVGTPDNTAPGDDVQRGVLVVGHGVQAHLQDGRVAIRDGPRLDWGEIDRLHTGAAGMVAASGGRVHLRTPAGEDRVVLERASAPVITATRILYVAGGQVLTSATHTGTGATTVVAAPAGRTITNLDLLDDTTLVVTVA